MHMGDAQRFIKQVVRQGHYLREGQYLVKESNLIYHSWIHHRLQVFFFTYIFVKVLLREKKLYQTSSETFLESQN